MLAMSLLVVLLSGVTFVVMSQFKKRHEYYDNMIEAKLSLIAGYQRISSNRVAIEAELNRVGKLDVARFYLKNSSPSLAAAEIQDVAQSVLDANGMKVNSVNIAPHKDKDGRRKITVNVSAHGNIEAIQKSLYALESTTPYLFVDNLSIRGTVNSRYWQPVPNVEPEALLIFDLFGYARIGKLK